MLPSGRQEREKTLSVTTNNPGDSAVRYVTELQPNDILMGRGAPIINYEGNVRFRELVRTKKADYVNTTRHQVKDEIARCILQEIKRREGHFLRRIDSETEMRRLGISEATKAWIIVDNDVALEKVKQALRDKDPEKRNDADRLLGSNFQNPTVNFSNEIQGFNASYLSNDMGRYGGQRSRLQELLQSQSVPANLTFQRSVQGENSKQHQLGYGIPSLSEQLQQGQSFAASLPPLASVGSGYRTSDYLRELLRRNQTLAYPSIASSHMDGDNIVPSSHQQYPVLGSTHSHIDQLNRLRNIAISQNQQLPLSDAFFESTSRLPNRLFPPVAHPMETTNLVALKSLLEEQEIMLQRQVRLGATTHPSDLAPYAAPSHFRGSQGLEALDAAFPLSRSLIDDSTVPNTVARMPPVSSRDKVETNRTEAKPQATPDDRKRKAGETEALTSLVSGDNAERAKRFVDKERNKKSN